jgi:hypothetical protein
MTEEELRAQYDREMSLYDQYLQETGGDGQTAEASVDKNVYLEEMHPEVSTADRLIAKNFSKDPETTRKFLETRYPNMDIMQRDGRIFLKNRAEKEFKAFDPEGWGQYVTSPLEAVRDIGDVGYDIAAGVGETAAAAGSGLAALPSAPFTFGAGPLAAAAVGGGTAGAGLEILRQKAGQILGLPQEELDTDQVKMAGAIGAASPLLFGTGAAVKGGVKGMSKEAAQQSQRGLLKRGYDVATEKAFPKATEIMTGVPATATQTMAKNLDKLDELNADGVLGYAENVHENLRSNLSRLKTDVGKKLEAAIDQSGEQISIVDVKNSFKKTISDIQANAPKNEESARLVKSLQDKFDELFTAEVPSVKFNAAGEMEVANMRKELADKIPASQAFSLQDQLRDAAELFRVKDGTTARYGASASRADKRGMDAASEGYRTLNKEFERVTGGLSKELKGEYKNLADLQRNLQPYFKDPQTTFNTLSNLGRKNRRPLFETLERLDKSYGVDLITPAKELEAFSYYGKPVYDPISTGGVTSTQRGNVARALGGAVGGYMGAMSGGGMPAMFLGTGLGSALAGKAASPGVVKGLVRGGKAVEKIGSKVTPSAKRANQLAPSAWLMMNDRE